MINIDRELKQDFETFCKKNYPRFTYESNIGNKRQWFYLEAGHIFEGWVHYEFFEGKVHLHIEKPDTPNLFNPKRLNDFIQENNKSDKVLAEPWGRNFQWTLIRSNDISTKEELFQDFNELYTIFDPIITQFEIIQDMKPGVEAVMLPIGEIINSPSAQLFVIPDYQRPYTWNKNNVLQLLEDINNCRNSGKRTYLIGSVILYNNIEQAQIEIVDGQQRLTTISLILKAIQRKKTIDSIKMELNFSHTSSFQNIALNFSIIEDWISLNIQNEEELFWNYLLNNCQLVKILVSELGEAFQMFDSQNGRGKPLLAYNLLKAYHIRAMELISQDEKILCDRRWENAAIYDPVPGNSKIPNIDILEGLFNHQLYKTRMWCKKIAAQNFSKEKIGEFKGFTVDKNHPIEFPYQNPQLLQYLTEKFYHNTLEGTVGTKSRFETGDSDCVNPFVSITQSIVNGKSFFDYIETYVDLYKKLFIELNTYEVGEFKQFYYKYCLNYDYKKNEHDGKSGRFLEHSFIAVGNATRTGDSYLREVYKSLIFLLFDKFGENVLLKYYQILYRIVYSQRLLLSKIDPDSRKLREFPIKYFNLIKNAKDKAELSDLKALAIKNTSNIGSESPVKLNNDVFNFIKGNENDK